MKMQVTKCKKSNKFTNMFLVVYEVRTVDFFTDEETVVEHTIYSKVPVEPGLRTVVKKWNETKFWIEEVKD